MQSSRCKVLTIIDIETLWQVSGVSRQLNKVNFMGKGLDYIESSTSPLNFLLFRASVQSAETNTDHEAATEMPIPLAALSKS